MEKDFKQGNRKKQYSKKKESLPTKKATAPYNFVPFSDKVLWAEDSEKDYCAIEKDGLTGEISYDFTAETPILVSGTKKGNKENNNEPREFYRNTQGKYAVPGSSLRGMIRHNMQILGFDTVLKDMHDYHILFRNLAGASEEAASTKKHYELILDIDRNVKPPVARKVNSGYLCNEKGHFVIYPTKEKFIPLPLASPTATDRDSGYCSDLLAHKNSVFYSETVQYRGNCRGEEGVLFQSTPVDGYETGVFFCAGKSVGKPNAKYLFPSVNKEARGIFVSEMDILSYKIDYKRRTTVNKDKKLEEFWKLPEEGEEKAVFYIELEGRCYFGMSQYLRISHKGSITDGLPPQQKEKATTFVDQLLGSKEDKEGNMEGLRSKVFFEDAITENPKEYGKFSVILGEPIPSFSAGYVKDGKHYSSPDFELRGYKGYWMKNFIKPPIPEKLTLASTLSPLDRGTQFKGKIRFQNLKKEELGLLLWALHLEEGCYQTIGMGKSLGMGRVKLAITEVKVFDFTQMYQNFSPSYQAIELEKTIESYQDFCETSLGISLKEEENIDEFFYLHKKIVTDLEKIQDMGYDRSKLTVPLKNISQMKSEFEGEKKAVKPEQPVKEEDFQSSLEALRAKFNGNR